MSSNVNDLAKGLYKTLTEKEDKQPKPADDQATVTKIDGDIVWVKIPGGIDETPVRRTVSAKPGDVVQVRRSGGRAWITGNATNPPTDDTQANIATRMAIGAEKLSEIAAKAAADAQESAGVAYSYADQAKTSASDAKESATNASEYAARALGNLSTVQSVTETLNWITKHGIMSKSEDYILTSDVYVVADKKYYTRSGEGTSEDPYVYTLVTNPSGSPIENGYYEGFLNPNHVYFMLNPNGDYEVGSSRYSIVTEPKVEDISLYYELRVDESLNNYVATHLSITEEGLWIIPDRGENKMLLATGLGVKYTIPGTYIIESDNVVSVFGKDRIVFYNNEQIPIVEMLNNYLRFSDGTGSPFSEFGIGNSTTRVISKQWVNESILRCNKTYSYTIDELTNGQSFSITLSIMTTEYGKVLRKIDFIYGVSDTFKEPLGYTMSYDGERTIECTVYSDFSSSSADLKYKPNYSYIGTTNNPYVKPGESKTVRLAVGGSRAPASIVYNPGINTSYAFITIDGRQNIDKTVSYEYNGQTYYYRFIYSDDNNLLTLDNTRNTLRPMQHFMVKYGSYASSWSDYFFDGLYIVPEECKFSYLVEGEGPYFTFGSRSISDLKGGYSTCIGFELLAESPEQTVIGKYNSNSANDVFEIGIGTSDDDRKNAFSVDLFGNAKSSGDVIDGEGNILSEVQDSVPKLDFTKSNYTDGGYSATVTSLAGGTYLGQRINLGTATGRYPIFNGFDISGSGTARIHTLGHYIFKDGGNWYAYVKMRNDNTSAINNITVTAYIIWISV